MKAIQFCKNLYRQIKFASSGLPFFIKLTLSLVLTTLIVFIYTSINSLTCTFCNDSSQSKVILLFENVTSVSKNENENNHSFFPFQNHTNSINFPSMLNQNESFSSNLSLFQTFETHNTTSGPLDLLKVNSSDENSNLEVNRTVQTLILPQSNPSNQSESSGSSKKSNQNSNQISKILNSDIPRQVLPEELCALEMNQTSFQIKTSELKSRKFLFIVKLYEQLSKAKLHLAEVIHLAKKFNRTLILPKVGGSRIGCLRNLSFCAYFDETLLGNYVDWIEENYYVQMMEALHHHPSPYLVCIKPENSNPTCLPDDSIFLKILKVSNYSSPSQLVNQKSNFVHVSSSRTSLENNHDKLMTEFKTHDDAQIIYYVKLSQHPSLIPNQESANAIHYSKHLWTKSKALVRERFSSKYIAIHLRFEHLAHKSYLSDRVLHKRVSKCASNLITITKNMMKKYKISDVFIASDVSDNATTYSSSTPMSAMVLNSDTWGNGVRESSAEYVFRMFLYIRKMVKGKTLPMLSPHALTYDVGVQSILDKLVCAQAHVFIGGKKICGGEGSYHKDILALRKANGFSNSLTFKCFD